MVITIAGALSPPVILAIARHRQYTSNQWWTYTRKQRFLAIGRGALLGTLLLPILAPLGIYKLFKFLGTKILRKTVYWIRLLDSTRESFFQEGTNGSNRREALSDEESDCDCQESDDESSMGSQMEGFSARQAEAPIDLQRGETNIDRYQTTKERDIEQPQARPSQLIPSTPDNCDVDENAQDVKRTRTILGSIEKDAEDKELTDPDVLRHEYEPVTRKMNNGREALSDHENNCGHQESNNHSSGELHIEDVSFHQAEAPIVVDECETNIDRNQSAKDQDLDQPQAGSSRQKSTTAVSGHDGLLGNCYSDESAEELKRVRAILRSAKEGKEKLTDFEVSCPECRLLERKTNNERKALSDEETDCGRRDTQRLWARKAVSETFFSVKIPNEESKERELFASLDENLCALHQRQKKTDQLVNDMKNNLNSVVELEKEAVQMLKDWQKNLGVEDTEVANGAVSKLFPQNADEGVEKNGPPQSQEIKNLPEKGQKKAKRRRKRRTGKHIVAETRDSSSASEANETPQKEGLVQEKPRKQSQLLPIKKHTETTGQKAGKTTPVKSGKATQEMSGEKDKNNKKKTQKTPKAKPLAEKVPKSVKDKTEAEQTQQNVPGGARRKLQACSWPKKNIPEAKSCPEQKPHKAQSRMTSKVVEVEKEKFKHTTPFNLGMKMRTNNFRKLSQGNTLPLVASDERDPLALYDEID